MNHTKESKFFIQLYVIFAIIFYSIFYSIFYTISYTPTLYIVSDYIPHLPADGLEEMYNILQNL